MFLSPFQHRKINHQKRVVSGETLIEHNYSFRGSEKNGNKRYVVIAEEYSYFVFIVKFYLQEHKSCEHKFNRLTGLNECSRVLATVSVILRELLQQNPYCSFGFVGSNSIGEEKNNTKRFKLYSRVISNFVSPVLFEHRFIRSKSAYIVLNRNNQEENLLDKIQEQFNRLYSF